MSHYGVVEQTQVGEETEKQQRAKARAMDEVYERHGKALERDHWGEYLAVSPTGDILLGPDLSEVTLRAVETFGLGTRVQVFKVGEIAVWTLR